MSRVLTTISAPGTRPSATRQPTGFPAVWSLAAAAALAAFYLATSIYIASHRLFWFDELFIVRLSQVPSITILWQALAHAADTMPPGYHLLMRAFGQAFGHSEVAMRLPSALAMVAGLLVTFDCARRLTDGLHGLIAMSVLTCSLLPYYGYETRPYGFYFLLSAVAFWIWTCTTDDSNRAALSFGVVLALAITMHYYAVLNIVPYALWEALRWRPGKRPSRKLIAGVLGVGIPTVVLLPLSLAFSRQFSRGFWAHPSFYQLRAAFFELFPDGLLLLVLAMIWIVVARPREGGTVVEPMLPAESLGWLFLFIPLAGFVVAELKTNAFLMRYFIGALPGIAVAFACLLWRHFRNDHRVSAGILLLVAGWGAASQWAVVQHPESVDPFEQQTATRQYLRLEDRLHRDGKRFIVLNNPMLHLEAAHYSRYPDEVVLLRAESGIEGVPTVRVQENLSQYSPMQIWQVEDLKTHAGETALIDPSPETLEALRQAGVQVEIRHSKPIEVVYLH